MLAHPTHERLLALGLLVEREHAERDSKRVAARLKAAALRHDACIEDADLPRRAVSTGHCSSGSPPGTGLAAMKAC
jgi:hypothetical protein